MSTTGTFGNASAGTGGRSLSAAVGIHAGFKFTAPGTSGISASKRNIVAVTTSGGIWESRLYTDNAGSPGTQIGSASTAQTLNSTGDITFTFPTPPAMTKSTVYWLVLANTNATGDVTFDTCTNDASYGSGRNNTITSITDSLPSSEDWRVQITYNVLTIATQTYAVSTVAVGLRAGRRLAIATRTYAVATSALLLVKAYHFAIATATYAVSFSAMVLARTTSAASKLKLRLTQPKLQKLRTTDPTLDQ